MKAINRKLLRDLALMWSQAVTIALVVASGVAGFIASFGAYDSLAWSRDRYYSDARFADVFASLKRAPLALERQLQNIPGAALIKSSVAHHFPITIAGVSDPIIGRLIGLEPNTPQALNLVELRRGRMPQPHHAGIIEVLVSEAFAIARKLQPGDRISGLINGKREAMLIVGLALSPEYVFAGLVGSPDQRGFGVFWMDRAALAAAYNMDGAFNQVAVRLAPGASEGAVIDELDRILSPFGGNSAHGRDRQLSHVILSSEIDQQRVLGTVLPSIFLGVAAFLLNVVLSRQIATQREQIAALKALGYQNRAIGSHYLTLVLLIVLLGVALGMALGVWLGQGNMSLYAESFRFPTLAFRLNPMLVLAAIGVSVLAAALATLHAIRDTVKLAPAEAMRPPAPGKYKPMLLERWGLQHWFSPAARMVVRTMERRPLRTGLTIFGIAAAMAIVITGAFWRDSIGLFMDTQFRQVMRGDISLWLIEARPARVLHELAHLPQVTAVEGSRSVSVKLVNANHQWHGAIIGKAVQPELTRIVGRDGIAVSPPQTGLLITDRLASRMDIKPGDWVQVEIKEGHRDVVQMQVSALVTEMLGMNAYMERRALNRILREGDVINQASVAVTQGHETELLDRIKELPLVAGSISRSVMRRNIEDITARNILVFSLVLTAFATIIAIGVVYNSARIALAERAWELASLRVLGFSRAEVSGFLLGELAIEIAMATPFGMLLGYLLASGILQLMKSDEFDFPTVIAPATYAYAALSVMVAGLVSALIVRRRIDTLDLVSVLKTRE